MGHVHPIWRILANEIMEISSLSDYDFICLVAHYNDLVDGSQNRLPSDVTNRGYDEATLKEIEKKKKKIFFPIESCNLRFTQPFGHLRFESIGYVLTLFESYQHGCLPYSGGVADQPAQIMEIFSVLAELKREQESKPPSENPKVNGRNKYKNKSRASR